MIKLGQKVKDALTGFEGIALARTEYLYGCTSIGVLPTKLKETGTPQDWVWVDEQRLDSDSKATAGGPQPNAPQR
jgi:hypothetical protein